MKRAVFIALSSLAVVGNAQGDSALRVAELSLGNGASRAGEQLRLAMAMVAEKESLKEAMNIIRQGYEREGAAIRSAAVLAEDPPAAKRVDDLARLFVESGIAADTTRFKSYASALGRGAELQSVDKMDDDEMAAAKLVPVRKKPTPTGFGGGGAGRQQGGDRAEASRTQYNTMEMRYLADGKHSLLDIRNAVSAEYGPVPVAKVTEFFKGLEKTGEFELTTR